MTKEGENLLLWKCHVTMAKKEAYICSTLQLQNLLYISFTKNRSFLLATSFLFCSPMAQDTTASLDKLSCTDYVDFGKC